MDDNRYVWYACYGSNLSSERFSYYIKGGFFEKNGRRYSGCRDKADWLESVTAFFPGSIYFGNSSSTWYGGGVAFYDPDGEGETFMRLYKVTWEQYLDIQEQEGRSPEWYGRVVDLGAYEDGCEIYTITSEERRPVRPPHPSYYNLINNAISEELGMGKAWTDSYMKSLSGARKMSDISLLKKINVLNRDDGEEFTVSHRLKRIEKLLCDSKYKYLREGILFRIYSKVHLEEIDDMIVVTSHVDCHKDISKCFSKEKGEYLHGTYDNSITNAAILSLMLTDRLPDNVAVAFTGDEEYEVGGAICLSEYLHGLGISFRCVVLDVTDEGFEKADFTIENNFWSESYGRKVIGAAEKTGYPWRFVASDIDDIPQFVPSELVSELESEEDESWTFDQYGIEVFSLCIPTYGEMHSDMGLFVQKKTYSAYIEAMAGILSEI